MTDTKTEPPPPAKKHTAFAQVIYRKIDETGDLAGKALVGVGGFGALATVHIGRRTMVSVGGRFGDGWHSYWDRHISAG